MSLLQMSLSGGVLILFITVVRVLEIHRLPKMTFLVLWGITALRLLLPFSISLPVSTPAGIDHWADTLQNEAIESIADIPTGQISSIQGSGASVPVQSTRPVSIFTVIWLAGAVLLALWFSVSYLRSIRKFGTALPDDSPFVREWLTAHRICRPLEVRSLDRISSPLTYGVLRPVILLPKNLERSNEAVLNYVLTHEYIHIRRFDNVLKVMFAAALCVHWFNPLVWVMYILVNRDVELACDDKVIRMLGEEQKSAYALTLISMEAVRNGASALYSHFSRLAIKERIEAIMKYRKTSALAIVFALILAVGAATAFAAASETDTNQSGVNSEGLTGAVHDPFDRSAEEGVDPEGSGGRADLRTPDPDAKEADTAVPPGKESVDPEEAGNDAGLRPPETDGKEPQTDNLPEADTAVPPGRESVGPEEAGNDAGLRSSETEGKEPLTDSLSAADTLVLTGKESMDPEETGDDSGLRNSEAGGNETQPDNLAEEDTVMPQAVLYPDTPITGFNAVRTTAFSATPSYGNYIRFWFQNNTGERVRVYLFQADSETVVGAPVAVDGNSQGSGMYSNDGADSGSYYVQIEAIESGGLIDGELLVAQYMTNPQ